MKAPSLAYGFAVYAIFLAAFLYLIGFLGNFAVPRSVDSGIESPLMTALLVDLLLLGLFGLQHSVMARPRFKKWWTGVIPEPIERSTYVLATILVLLLMYWQWRPIPDVIWEVTSSGGAMVLWVLFGAGWGLILLSTFLIDHFELFGLSQVVQHARGKQHSGPPFQVNMLYKFVRHPLYVGWLMVFWATPLMSAGHLLFSVVWSVYILIAIQVEERDLLQVHGQAYADYREQVPMLLPTGKKYNEAPGQERGSSA